MSVPPSALWTLVLAISFAATFWIEAKKQLQNTLLRGEKDCGADSSGTVLNVFESKFYGKFRLLQLLSKIGRMGQLCNPTVFDNCPV